MKSVATSYFATLVAFGGVDLNKFKLNLTDDVSEHGREPWRGRSWSGLRSPRHGDSRRHR